MAELQKLKENSGDNGVSVLEKRLGKTLPDTYLKFLMSYNGATASPSDFESIWFDDQGREELIVASLHYLFDGAEVVKTLDMVQSRIPPKMVPIGQDPGGNLILLSVSSDTESDIHYWMNAYSEYGEPDNYRVGEIAPDFQSFLDGLFDESDY